MHESIPEVYQLETIEQIRAVADELRQRIVRTLRERPMTVTQVGEALGLAPARIHYHVRELERVGLVRLVETREKGGILEKYYRPVARSVVIPPSLLQSLSPDERFQAAAEFLEDISSGFMRAFEQAAREQFQHDEELTLLRSHIWATSEEMNEIQEQVRAIVKQYETPHGVEGERERTFVHMLYSTLAGVEQEASADSAPAGREESSPRKRRRAILMGALRYDRAELQAFVDRGEALDLTALGTCTFAEDVTPDLADRAFLRFRHRGRLNASTGVREVLERKEALAT